MVPKRLGEDLCSLHQHVDRLAFSVLWTMDEQANITGTKFHKTVIRSEVTPHPHPNTPHSNPHPFTLTLILTLTLTLTLTLSPSPTRPR